MIKEFRIVLNSKDNDVGKVNRLPWVLKTLLNGTLDRWDVESVIEVLKEDNPNTTLNQSTKSLSMDICKHCGAVYWWHRDGKCHDEKEFEKKEVNNDTNGEDVIVNTEKL